MRVLASGTTLLTCEKSAPSLSLASLKIRPRPPSACSLETPTCFIISSTMPMFVLT